MTIVGIAEVPGKNGTRRHYLSQLDTAELPRQPSGPAGPKPVEPVRESTPAAAQPAPSLPCPAFCHQHKHYPQNEDRNVWGHTSRPTTVQATYADDAGPTETNTVEVQAERFDFGTRPGHPVVLLAVDGTDPTGMTPEQAEQIGRALLDSAAAVRAESAGSRRASVSTAWPPAECPPWCSFASRPGGHASNGTEVMHPVDRHHSWLSETEQESDVYLSLHTMDMVNPATDQRLIPQRLTLGMEQHYRHVEPTISITHQNRGWRRKPDAFIGRTVREVNLTPAEARQLGQRLVALADMADGAA